MELRAILEEKGKLHAQMTEMLDAAAKDMRGMSQEDKEKYSKIETRYDELDDLHQKAIKAEERKSALIIKPAGRPGDSLRNEDGEDTETRAKGRGETSASGYTEEQERDILRRYFDRGFAGLSADEMRGMQADSDEAGGHLILPKRIKDSLIKNIDDETVMLREATVEELTDALSIGIPTLDTDLDDAEFTDELNTGSEDPGLKIGMREMSPYPAAKRTKLSRKLIRLSPRAEALVLSRLAYKFAITLEKAVLVGSGINAPLGLFTTGAKGSISNARDIATDNTATEVTADNLIEVKYSMKAAYWNRAKWLCSRKWLKKVRKLKDANDQYLWQPGLQAGQADRILDCPFIVSEFVPDTFTTGKRVAVLGDLKRYLIIMAQNLTVQRLNELYAEKNQIGFIGRMELDGQPTLEEAFSFCTLG